MRRSGLVLAGVLASAGSGHADDGATPPADAAGVVARGAVIGGGGAARVDGRRGLALSVGGYDGASARPRFEAVAEATLGGRIALRFGGVHGPEGLGPVASVQVDALREARHGVDLAVATGYERASFNTVPGVFARLGVGHAVGAGRIGASATVGLGLEEDERHGALEVGAVRPIGRGLHLGAEARFGIDLERDADEPEDEPDWQIAAGPVAAFTRGRFVVTARGGISAVRYRLTPGTRTGAIGLLGAGLVF